MPQNKLLSILVVLILITNFFLISEIEDLNNRIQTITNNYNSLQSGINSVTSNVNQSLDRFTREQSWITPVRINNEKSKVDDEQGLVVVNWQIKDYQEGSEVFFHYRESESEEFKTIPAESVDTGFFEVTLPFEMKAEPHWELNVSWTTERGVSERVTEQKAREEIKQSVQTIRCYVSTKVGGMIRSSELSYLNYEYLANMKYEPVRGHISMNDNQYNIAIFEDNNTNNSFESLTVEFYNGNNLIVREPLELQEDQNGMKHYFLSGDTGSENISQIILEVKYENGDNFKREVF